MLNGDASASPKAGDGPVEALRQLRVARAGAIKARTAAANQLHSLCDTAPEELRAHMGALSFKQKIATAEKLRRGTGSSPEASAKRALRSVARRWRFLDDEAKELRNEAERIIDAVAPQLIARPGVGYETAGQLLVTAGDNPGPSPLRTLIRRTMRLHTGRGIHRADQTTPAQPRW